MSYILKVTAVVLVAVMLAGGCSRGNKKEQKVQLSGSEQKKTGLLKTIDKKYESPEAHYQLGKLYYGDSLYDKAEWEYTIALGYNPVHRPAQAAMVKTLQMLGNESKAKVSAEIYMKQASSSAQTSSLLGQAFQNEGLEDYAMTCYQQALRLSPNSWALYKQIGYHYLAKKDMVRAEENLRRSFELNPYQPEVAGELGKMGVIVQVPRKTEKNPKKIDRMLEGGKTK